MASNPQGFRTRHLRWLVLPQALTAMLPSLVNQWVTLIKDSSLAYIVGVGELSFLSTQVNARLMVNPAEVFVFVGGVYWLLCSLLHLLSWAIGRQQPAQQPGLVGTQPQLLRGKGRPSPHRLNSQNHRCQRNTDRCAQRF